MILLLACAVTADTAPPAPDPIVPEEGEWAVSFAQTWEGDCVLEDMSTQQPASSTWAIEREPVGFTLYDETGYPSGCTLDTAGTFACPDGVYDVSYHESGYDAVEYITSTVEGAFADSVTMDAALKITADCDGGDCAAVGTMYGDQFEYGCTAVAPFTGVWVGPA